MWVASHPCIICRNPATQAHHLMFAQPRGKGMKVSDEFTVPLCARHHDALHHYGDEPGYWQKIGIDPLAHALRLWVSGPACDK